MSYYNSIKKIASNLNNTRKEFRDTGRMNIGRGISLIKRSGKDEENDAADFKEYSVRINAKGLGSDCKEILKCTGRNISMGTKSLIRSSREMKHRICAD